MKMDTFEWQKITIICVVGLNIVLDCLQKILKFFELWFWGFSQTDQLFECLISQVLLISILQV